MQSAEARRGAIIGITTAAALILLVALFLDWYELASTEGDEQAALSGWQSLEVGDGLLVLVAACACFAVFTGRIDLIVPLGLTAVVLVAAIVITDVPYVSLTEIGASSVSASRQAGLFMAAAGAAGLGVAGILAALLDRSD